VKFYSFDNIKVILLNDLEDKGNKVDDLKVPQSDLVGKYPSALAVGDLINTHVIAYYGDSRN
jgi:hypothetical protein